MIDRWVFVDGFTQPGGAWRAVAAIRGVPASYSGAPIAGSFVDAANALGRSTSFLEGEQRLEHTAYAGYSQGGRLCLQFALDRPDMVSALVLVSASPGIDDGAERAARRAADERLAQEIERDGVDAFLDRWLAQPLFATLPRERAGIEDRKRANTVERLTQQLRVLGQGSQPSNWNRLDELAMPVLLIVGALDTKYVAVARDMAAAIPRVRLEIIDGAGHACHLEQPEHVGQLLRDWSAAL